MIFLWFSYGSDPGPALQDGSPAVQSGEAQLDARPWRTKLEAAGGVERRASSVERRSFGDGEKKSLLDVGKGIYFLGYIWYMIYKL